MTDPKHVLPLRLSTQQNSLLTKLARSNGQPVSRYVLAAIAAFVGSDWPTSVDGRRARTSNGDRVERESLPQAKLEHLRATDRARSQRHRERRAAARAGSRDAFAALHVREADE
jgi:hypothetical protein